MVFLLKLSICWAFFALLYTLLLRRETFFHSNRLYLLATLLGSICLAAAADLLPAPAANAPLTLVALPVVVAGFEGAEAVSKQMESIDYLWMIYFSGFLLMLFRTLWGIAVLVRLAARATSQSQHRRYKLLRSEEIRSPFSFFRWIFVPASDWEESSETGRYVLAHERAHAEAWHSADVLLLECLCALFWFHPLVYWYRRALRSVHEYQADAQASRLHDKKQYGLLLIRQAQSGMPLAFVNHFFQSPLKQRIIMLMKQHSRPARAFRYGLALPLTALFILLFQKAPVLAEKADVEPRSFQSTPAAVPAKPWPAENTPCEQAPSFPAEKGTLVDHIGKNLRYPAESAMQEGTIVVSFTIKEDGHLQDVYVKEAGGMPDVYQAEALRVISMLPKWNPGLKDCKPARFELCIPIQFRKSEAQTAPVQKTLNLMELETVPQFPGGESAMMQFLAKNIEFPAIKKEEVPASTLVAIQFVIEADGQISNAKVVNADKVHPAFAAEALRVVQSMPAWSPGIADGKKARTEFTLPVRFDFQ